jgi:hypothetical protein
MIEWLFVVINIIICLWDSFASGILWRHAETGMEKVIAAAALIVGVVGMLYTVVLVAVILGYLPEAFLIAQNVILGIPLVCAGVVITVDGWRQAIRTKKWWMFAISLWNTFAMVWDIIVIIKSLSSFGSALKEIAKFGKESPSSARVFIFLGLALLAAGVLAVALFYAGMDFAERHAGVIRRHGAST